MRRCSRFLRAAAVLACSGGVAACAIAAEAYVRINQLGYESGLPNRAYLMVRGTQSGGSFSVLDSHGHAVLSAPIGASAGAWGAFNVYPLDFTLSGDGWYSIQVGGPNAAASNAFHLDTADQLYGGGLAHGLSFFQNQRDGSQYIASALRHAPAHLNDKQATVYSTPAFTPDDDEFVIGDLVPTGAVIDAEGGWADAGDYIKFVQTHSYSVAMLLTGVRDFPQQMGHGAPSDYTAEAKFGLNWLMKMWDDKSRTLYYQVGIGSGFRDHPNIVSDHDIWRLPQVDDTYGGKQPSTRYIRHRPVFVVGPADSKISPNLAGRLAASFSLCAMAFKTEDPGLAQKCLLSAEHVFDLADTNPKGDLLTVAPHGFYPEVEWRDDMEWGAAELALALQDAGHSLPAGLPHGDPGFYLKKAATWAKAYIDTPLADAPDPLNLYDVGGHAHFELVRAIDRAEHLPGMDVSRADLLANMLKQLKTFESVGSSDPFGFGFTWAAWDTPAHGIGLSILAEEYYALTGDEHWAGESRRWLGNVLGANAWGLSLIVGDGTQFPACLQHQVANLVGSLDGQGVVLAGAVVEGPNASDSVVADALDGMKPCGFDTDPYAAFNGNGAEFRDDARNYPNTEPAIDLSAASPLMFAWRIGGSPDFKALGF